MQAVARPNYAYCMLNAALLAKSLGLRRISAIEFGVAGGNGLAFMVNFAKDIERATGVEVECFGFDTGEGMPPPENKLDLPYWFQSKMYHMDKPKLAQAGLLDKIVIGNVAETVPRFVAERKPAPIGAIT